MRRYIVSKWDEAENILESHIHQKVDNLIETGDYNAQLTGTMWLEMNLEGGWDIVLRRGEEMKRLGYVTVEDIKEEA